MFDQDVESIIQYQRRGKQSIQAHKFDRFGHSHADHVIYKALLKNQNIDEVVKVIKQIFNMTAEEIGEKRIALVLLQNCDVYVYIRLERIIINVNRIQHWRAVTWKLKMKST